MVCSVKGVACSGCVLSTQLWYLVECSSGFKCVVVFYVNY